MRGGLEKKPKQTEKILDYVREFGGITAYQAFVDLGVCQLAARIFELEREGTLFDRTTIKSKNRMGDEVRYIRYSLKEV